MRCKHHSHNLWRACFSSTIQNMPIIMSMIVWENLKVYVCLFLFLFWKILTKYNGRKPVFYHLGPKKYEKSHFWAGIRHLWNQRKVVSTKSAITTKIVGSRELFLAVRWETKFSNKISYKKFSFLPSFSRNELFLIFQTIRVIIHWH